mmetsp:Transcript_9223/g.19748  ORF Transcript_9223/g.19748 Transcript_9223/m.19748 type:complete len:255 (+) Transcript_9223:537-1301(+)
MIDGSRLTFPKVLRRYGISIRSGNEVVQVQVVATTVLKEDVVWAVVVKEAQEVGLGPEEVEIFAVRLMVHRRGDGNLLILEATAMADTISPSHRKLPVLQDIVTIITGATTLVTIGKWKIGFIMTIEQRGEGTAVKVTTGVGAAADLVKEAISKAAAIAVRLIVGTGVVVEAIAETGSDVITGRITKRGIATAAEVTITVMIAGAKESTKVRRSDTIKEVGAEVRIAIARRLQGNMLAAAVIAVEASYTTDGTR